MAGRLILDHPCHRQYDGTAQVAADLAASPGPPACRPSRTRVAVLLRQCVPGTHPGPTHRAPQRRVHMMASGERTKSEVLGLGDHEFVPWQIGIMG